MSETSLKIGVFGGAFDPPHLGHLIAAQYAAEYLALDKVIFVPSGKHPFKQGQLVASADQRYAMTKLAVAGNPIFEVSDVEVNAVHTTYTVDTLEHFHRLYPHDQLFFFIGKDNVAEFAEWKSPEEIVKLSTVVVLDRVIHTPDPSQEGNVILLSRKDEGVSNPTPLLRPVGGVLTYLDTPTIEISSREIRTRIAEGKSVRYLIRNGVELFMDMMGLYR